MRKRTKPVLVPEAKLYPGEIRIIKALIAQDCSWTRLKVDTGLDNVTLTKYLKRLRSHRMVEHDEMDRLYSLPKTLQPILHDSEGYGTDLILRAIRGVPRTVKLMKNLPELREDSPRLTSFLRLHLGLLLGQVTGMLQKAVDVKDDDLADEYVRRFVEHGLDPWLRTLAISLRELPFQPIASLETAVAPYIEASEKARVESLGSQL